MTKFSSKFYSKILTVLRALPPQSSKAQRKAAILSVYKPALKANESKYGDPGWVAGAFDTYCIAREQFLAAYARDVRVDSYGKPDERKFQLSVNKIAKREGLYDFSGGMGGFFTPINRLIVEFTRVDFAKQSAKFKSSAYDRGMSYEREIVSAVKVFAEDVQPTSSGADFGADLTFSAYGLSFVGQCKALNKSAGVKAIQEAVSAVAHYKCDYAAVFSTNGFSEPALLLAESNKVIVITGTNLSTFERQLTVYVS